MNARRFGATDLAVSEVGFGCARLGGIFSGSSKADTITTLRRAYDAGITFFDTSDMYCQGESERLLGEAFRGRRDGVVIATKGGYCLPGQRRLVARMKPLIRPVIRRLGLKRGGAAIALSGRLSQNFSPDYLVGAVERSLKRLRTDYLDLYQLHSPPTAVLEDGDFLVPLERLKRDGKIRYIGVSCETVEDALICLRYPEIAALQIRLNLIDQRALESLVPLARDRGVALIARECFGGGIFIRTLTGLQLDFLADGAAQEELRRDLTGLHRIAEALGRTLPEAALQFVRAIPGISVTLLGMRTAAQLQDNLHLLAKPPLSEGELGSLRRTATV